MQPPCLFCGSMDPTPVLCFPPAGKILCDAMVKAVQRISGSETSPVLSPGSRRPDPAQCHCPGRLRIYGSEASLVFPTVGQILRNATALAAITGTAIVVHRVREGRSQPGLRPQHLTGLRLLDAICGGEGGLAAGGEVSDAGQPSPLLSRTRSSRGSVSAILPFPRPHTHSSCGSVMIGLPFFSPVAHSPWSFFRARTSRIPPLKSPPVPPPHGGLVAGGEWDQSATFSPRLPPKPFPNLPSHRAAWLRAVRWARRGWSCSRGGVALAGTTRPTHARRGRAL